MIHFAADVHFGSEYIRANFRKQFSSVDMMDNEIIDRWNSVVKQSDTVVIVGDFSEYSAYKTVAIAKKLHGKKHLVLGNVDEFIKDSFVKSSNVFMTVGDSLNLKDPDRNRWYMCSHYAMLSWKNKDKGTVLLHGHTHSAMHQKVAEETEQEQIQSFSIRDAYDAGIDGNNLFPISGDVLNERIKCKNWTRIPTNQVIW